MIDTASDMTTRREFLKNVTLAAIAAGSTPAMLTKVLALPPAAGSDMPGIVVPGEDGMILRSFRFLDLETPVEYFNTWLTPAEHFFVRNHMHEPSTLDPGEWKLSVSGEVEKPYTLT